MIMEPDTPVSSTTARRLSKSKYLAGLQCLKRVYLELRHPHLASPPDATTQAMLNMGSEIGELARSLFPGGVFIGESHRQREAALARTISVMNDLTVPAMFEGAFEHDGVLVRVDILQRIEGETTGREAWRLIEVKSSSRVKDVHLDDLAIQRYVLQGAGMHVTSTCLLHINTQYLYQGGDIDLQTLFTLEDVSQAVTERGLLVPDRLAAMKSAVKQSEAPSIEPDRHCHVPYECPFWAHCTTDKPPRWVYRLPGSKQVVSQLIEQGIATIDEIPDGTKLTMAQRRVKDNVEWISPKLHTVLGSVQYPVHHLDFETVMLAIPRFPSTRPYQALPVQWSNHIELESGELRHEEFLHVEASDPRTRLAETLIESLGEEGHICVYSPYERSVLEQLAEVLPHRRPELKQIIARIWDLYEVIKEHYYHPGFLGSYSIKDVLPAVVPSLGYDDLMIKEGGQAASEYYRMVFLETDWIERAKIEEALLQYCKRDTLAMVELRRALQEKAKIT
jgi:Domain of unknown function(DUF2779)